MGFFTFKYHCTDSSFCLLKCTTNISVHVTVSSCHCFRRGGLWLTCRTHASLHGIGNVSVSVSIDRAHLQKDLQFEYVEDPTITKIEPEWSIFRYTFLSVYFDSLLTAERYQQNIMRPVDGNISAAQVIVRSLSGGNEKV